MLERDLWALTRRICDDARYFLQGVARKILARRMAGVMLATRLDVGDGRPTANRAFGRRFAGYIAQSIFSYYIAPSDIL